MATVSEILAFIESIAPAYMAEDWDKIGLNCGRLNRDVNKILVALDPFPHVCREAVECGAHVHCIVEGRPIIR